MDNLLLKYMGKGQCGILHGRPGALHIRLQAPAEWRIPEICKLKNVSETEAMEMI